MCEELRHTHLTGPWYYCGVCYEKTKIADATWQRGVLKCPTCVDKMLLGDLEVRIAVVLEDGKEELAPVEKLREPLMYTEVEDITL
jgi:hypothetical protein